MNTPPTPWERARERRERWFTLATLVLLGSAALICGGMAVYAAVTLT